MKTSQSALTKQVKTSALSFGFDLVGIASTHDPLLSEAATRYKNWIDAGNSASMEYLSRHLAKKQTPTTLIPQVSSIICVALFYDGLPVKSKHLPLISSYTCGEDYHHKMQELLASFEKELKQKFGGEFYSFTDDRPVFERFWAWRAGLGWIGKNAMLIHRMHSSTEKKPRSGSYLFLGGLLTTLDLASDEPDTDHCGKCTKCIDACPTNAILPERAINSNLCIAYHTIENRSEIPASVMENFGTWIAGCDICQMVCPWNSKTPVIEHAENPAFDKTFEELASWSEEDFKNNLQNFSKKFSMYRMKYHGFLRNLAIAVLHAELSKNSKKEILQKLVSHGATLKTGKAPVLKTIEWANKKLIQD